jgi:predicted transglutaminase-like cysteine proteinase
MAGTFGRAALAVLTVAAGVLSSTAGEAASRYMLTGAVTSQPIGHYQFCQGHEAECSVVSTNTTAAKVTAFGWNVIREINAEVNSRILPMTDQDIFGKDEVWSYPTDVGDCEDFVLEKRRELMDRGFSPANLLITVVRKPDGEGHAVLTVRTADGDYILDNLDDSVRLWSETPYRFMKRQAENNTGRWVKIENSSDVLVGAVDK